MDRFHRAQMRLKDSPAVLVGHNMFTDLVSINQIPCKVELFRFSWAASHK